MLSGIIGDRTTSVLPYQAALVRGFLVDVATPLKQPSKAFIVKNGLVRIKIDI